MTTTRKLLRPFRYVTRFGVAALTGALGIAAYTGRSLNTPRRQTWLDNYTFSPFEMQVPYEPVSFVTEDGVTIRGWWLPRAESRRVVVACTGHRGAKHELLGIASGLWRAGDNVLLFDFRGCGESDPAPPSVGHNELPDARAAVRFAQERLPAGQIGLLGYSMGGAVAILVAAADPSVRAVVADSSYAAISDVIANAYRRRRLPAQPFLAVSDRYNGWRYGYRYAALRPVDAIGRLAPRPVLLIHGAADELTPVAHAEELYAAAGEPKDLWIVPGAPHCCAYFADREAYVARVAAFFAGALGTR
jgi:alpha-beta hydrolase superfamily lysophospholipase